MNKNRRSVATIDSPEFINVTSISPLISKCEVKVLYVGENRNRSFITKEVAAEMAKTLPGCPIVGYYIENKKDFGDHGDQMIVDGEGIKFKNLTKPYGFVAPDAKIWFQKFEDIDEFGNSSLREYLMTEGYLWTGQYEEAKTVMTEKGKPQSMELDKETLKGYWSTDNNRGIDFFIINDAIISKLCILGEDVEPCFEGADVTTPKLCSTFSKDENFSKSLFTMMQELKYTLNKGGISMQTVENETEKTSEDFSLDMDKVVENTTIENDNVIDETSKCDSEDINQYTEKSKEDDEEDSEEKTGAEEDKEPSEAKEEKEEEDKEEKIRKNELSEQIEELQSKNDSLQSELSSLQEKYSALQSEYNILVDFKTSIEDEKKDALIDSFYMLSEEDKKEVRENKKNYSLEDIESKLSVICVRNKVSFSLEETSKIENKEDNKNIVTYNLNSIGVDENIPGFLSALRNNRK